MDFSCLFTVVVLTACFLLGRSAPVYRLFLLFSSINRFSSGQVRSSPSTQLFLLLVASSASVRRLFMFFYSPVPLQSVDCFCSSRRLIASLLDSFAVVVDCFCCSSRPFRFSPSIVSALLVARSASVRPLFMLFSSINRFSSRQFRSSPSITSALLIDGFGRS